MKQTKLPQGLALVAVLLTALSMNAQSYKFYQSVGESIESIVPLANGEMFLTSGSFNGTVIYSKTNPGGQPMYTRLLRDLSNTEAVDIEGISNQGQQLILAGTTGEIPETPFLVRLNLDGDTLWSRKITGTWGNYSTLSDLVEMPNDEFALAVSNNNFGQQYRAFLNRVDTLGGQVWSKELFASGGDVFRSVNIFPATTGNILAQLGAVDTNSSSLSASVLALFDGTGNNLFAKAFNVPGYGDIFWRSGIQTSDGGWAAMGYDLNDFATDHAVVLIKYSAQGAREFTKVFHFNQPISNMGLYDFMQTSDGGFAATGFLSLGSKSGIPLLRWDSNGDFLWGKSYGGPDPAYYCYGRGLMEATNGNISIVGEDNRWKSSFGAVIIETSPTGATSICTPSDITLLPLTVMPTETNYPVSMGPGPSWNLETSNLEVENLSTGLATDLVLGARVGEMTETTCENVCDGVATLEFDSIAFSSGVQNYIVWPGGETGYAADSLCSGTGTVVVGTDLGCKVNVDYTLGAEPLPGFSYTINGLQVELSQNAPSTNCLQDGFLWIYGDGNVDSLTANPTYNFANSGNYTICIRCKTSACSTCVTVALPGSGSGNSVSVPGREEEASSILLYPNPANDAFNFLIEGELRSAGQIRVIDTFGRVVFHKSCGVAKVHEGEIDVSGLARGIYQVEWQQGDRRTSRALLLE